MQVHLMNILATWRITRLLSVDYGERGPFAILDRAREYVSNHAKGDVYKSVVPNYETGKVKEFIPANVWMEVWDALLCQFCLSVWVGICLAIVTRQNVLWGLAYSAGSLLFGRIFERLEQ